MRETTCARRFATPRARSSREEISRRAYAPFLARGGEHARDVEDWIRAERELREEKAAARQTLWAVVLAGGEGRRLCGLTRALYGRDLPKQFAVIERGRSLLQGTVDRVSRLVPSCRTVVVVGEAHESLARRQLARYPGLDLAVQPRNLDTAPGILFPLARILARDPQARVAVFPSDHYLPRPEPFLAAVETAAEALSRLPGRLILVGVEPEGPADDYGWILPGGTLPSEDRTGFREVSGFVEKPSAADSSRLLRRGGLWNTFVTVGLAGTYAALARALLPRHAALFEAYAREVGRPGEAEFLRRAYARMESANFSRAVLERAPNLAVLQVSGTGWCDWGSPERVFESLPDRRHLEALLDRIGSAPRRPRPAAIATGA